MQRPAKPSTPVRFRPPPPNVPMRPAQCGFFVAIFIVRLSAPLSLHVRAYPPILVVRASRLPPLPPRLVRRFPEFLTTNGRRAVAKELLRDLHVRNAKPRETVYRLADGGNLYL